jgi:hypothetical protein
MMDKRAGALAVVILIATAGDVLAECVDLNAASHERLTSIVHINEERADQVIAGRPWPGVRALTQVHGIGRGRIRDILEQDLACVGVRVPAGARERIEGVATVLDGDALEINGTRIRLIGIDALEGGQLCHLDGNAWPCGQMAPAIAASMAKGYAHEPINLSASWGDASLRLPAIHLVCRC